jgi:actin-like ATPase involved in cell morphogenesis
VDWHHVSALESSRVGLWWHATLGCANTLAYVDGGILWEGPSVTALRTYSKICRTKIGSALQVALKSEGRIDCAFRDGLRV